VKKYANRRLYDTGRSSYVTLDDLCDMVKKGYDFVVYDAKSGDDITRSVLTQIIVEEESKGQNLLPISFLRQLISFYGDSMQWVVPRYLEYSMHSLSRNQEQMRDYFQNTFGGVFPFGTLEEVGKQNIAMFERAMRMFAPFPGTEGGTPEMPTPPQPGAPMPTRSEADRAIGELQQRLDELQRQLGSLTGTPRKD
jgi:polyhydroxyalkanoate synthesis repressor PhaR